MSTPFRMKNGPEAYGERRNHTKENRDALQELGALLTDKERREVEAAATRALVPPLAPGEIIPIHVEKLQRALSTTRIQEMATIGVSLTFGEMMEEFVAGFFEAAGAADKDVVEVNRSSLATIFHRWSKNAQASQKGPAQENQAAQAESVDAGTARGNARDTQPGS